MIRVILGLAGILLRVGGIVGVGALPIRPLIALLLVLPLITLLLIMSTRLLFPFPWGGSPTIVG